MKMHLFLYCGGIKIDIRPSVMCLDTKRMHPYQLNRHCIISRYFIIIIIFVDSFGKYVHTYMIVLKIPFLNLPIFRTYLFQNCPHPSVVQRRHNT